MDPKSLPRGADPSALGGFIIAPFRAIKTKWHEQTNPVLAAACRTRGLEWFNKRKCHMVSSLLNHERLPTNYRPWKNADLKVAIQGRKLAKLSKHGTAILPRKKESLIEILVDSDRTPNFPRFMELPAELRVMIYEYVCAPAGKEIIVHPTIPAICRRVDSDIRAESIPIFFSTHSFELHVTLIDNRYYEQFGPHGKKRPILRALPRYEYYLDAKDEAWLFMVRPWIHLIRHIAIRFQRFYRNEDPNQRGYDAARLTHISFGPRMKSVNKVICRYSSHQKLVDYPKMDRLNTVRSPVLDLALEDIVKERKLTRKGIEKIIKSHLDLYDFT